MVRHHLQLVTIFVRHENNRSPKGATLSRIRFIERLTAVLHGQPKLFQIIAELIELRDIVRLDLAQEILELKFLSPGIMRTFVVTNCTNERRGFQSLV